jgi:hypothetical protein
LNKNITSHDIVEMLREKHSKDVFVKECKDGPTWAGSHLRMDAWVMRSSWAQMSCLAYEVKVSRSDFLQDNKWNMYMNYCNEFSFCCPYGLILPEELPQEVGLYWVSKTGNRLMCKRKPVYRNVKIPESIFMYILMCRVVLKDESISKSRKEYWINWLKTKEYNRSIGHNASKSIREVINKEVEKVREENERLQNKIDNCKKAIDTFERAGISLEYLSTWNINRKIDEIKSVLPIGFVESLEKLQSVIGSTLKYVKEKQKEVA